MLNYVVCLCKRCDGCCVFCVYCESWSCRCSMFVSCVHPVAVTNAAFCMTYSLLMVEDARPLSIALSALIICRRDKLVWW